jgi:hypothetical protein
MRPPRITETYPDRKNGAQTAIPTLPPRVSTYKNLHKLPEFAIFQEKHSDADQEGSRQRLKKLNDDMRAMLKTAQDTRSAIREVNEAFHGEQEFDYIAQIKGRKTRVKKVARRKLTDRGQGASCLLNPISDRQTDQAVVVFDNSKQKQRLR